MDLTVEALRKIVFNLENGQSKKDLLKMLKKEIEESDEWMQYVSGGKWKSVGHFDKTQRENGYLRSTAYHKDASITCLTGCLSDE